MEDHAHWMRRAVRVAMNGRGHVEPNPMVGCVIVKDGRLIGEGYHQQFGGPHAEPNALAACTESPAGATVYVTLEPCCHTNKKTPPCVPKLIEARVGRVVIGCHDPNPEVKGRGAAQLRGAGIEVTVPVLEGACRQLLAPFIARTVYRRPYVTLKWVETADGKVAGYGGRRLRISSERSTRIVHELRALSDAVVVGMGTVTHDDPLLTARGVAHARPLVRGVIGSRSLAMGSQLLQTVAEGPVVLYCAPGATGALETEPETGALVSVALKKLRSLRVEVVAVPEIGDHRVSLEAVLHDLWKRGLTHALIEPGPTLAASFIAEGRADRVWVFRSAKTLDELTTYTKKRLRGLPAPSAVGVPYPPVATTTVGADTLTEYLNPVSPVFFAPEPSADFVLAEENSSRDDRLGAPGVGRQ
jgi:diaminohydroxyphosphoribosylaminopyrimidine deaminase/5-amino-6-(5-phosphoribosylamino)uracil reductase